MRSSIRLRASSRAVDRAVFGPNVLPSRYYLGIHTIRCSAAAQRGGSEFMPGGCRIAGWGKRSLQCIWPLHAFGLGGDSAFWAGPSAPTYAFRRAALPVWQQCAADYVYMVDGADWVGTLLGSRNLPGTRV